MRSSAPAHDHPGHARPERVRRGARPRAPRHRPLARRDMMVRVTLFQDQDLMIAWHRTFGLKRARRWARRPMAGVMRYHRGAIRPYRPAPHRAGVPQPRTAVPADRAMATDLNGPGSGPGREIGTGQNGPRPGTAAGHRC